MKPRLSRPLVTAIVAGALAAGGAVYTSPVQAAQPVGAAPVLTVDDPSASASAPGNPDASASAPGNPDASASAPGNPDASASAPGNPDASASAPGNPDASASAPGNPNPSASQPSASPSGPARDTTAPTGTFRLNSGALWLGQTLVFSQGTSDFTDDRSLDNQITRKINWGDGTSLTLFPHWTTVNKKYTRNGKFTVTVTLTDKAGNSRNLTKTVTITTPAKGSYSLSTKKVYQGVSFGVTVKKLPAGATGFVIDWADGTTSYHAKKSGTIKGFILYKVVNGEPTNTRISGVRTIRVSPVNKFGASLYQEAGKINVLKDNWKPKLTFTKPSPITKASAWKTLRGTASDKGSGLIQKSVWLTVIRYNTSGTAYCLTPKKKWIRVNTGEEIVQCFVQVKVKSGKWSLTLPKGVAKGYIQAGVVAVDYSDRYKSVTRESVITKN